MQPGDLVGESAEKAVCSEPRPEHPLNRMAQFFPVQSEHHDNPIHSKEVAGRFKQLQCVLRAAAVSFVNEHNQLPVGWHRIC